MSKHHTTPEALALLRARVATFATQAAAARALGISVAYLNDVLRGRRAIGPSLARAMGWRAETVFVETDTSNSR